MNDFFQKALKEALEQVCSDIQEIIEDIFEELEEELPGAVAQSQKEAERWKNELERINTDNYRKETEKMIEEAEGVLAGCQLVMKLMEG